MSSYTHFLVDQEPLRNYETAAVVVFPCPYERTTSYLKGTALGPERILEASQQVEFFDSETSSDASHQGIYTYPPFDYSAGTDEECLQKTQEFMEKEFRREKWILTLGGEHTISLAPVRAAVRVFGANAISVLHLDAHSDMRASYEGNPYSHACVMRRIHEIVHHSYSVGIRAQCEEEYRYLKDNKTRFGVLYDHDRELHGIDVDTALSYLPTPHVYLSIDLDYFSPEAVPSVGTPVPGGGRWYETLQFLRKIVGSRHIVGADIVELRPDHNRQSEFLAAQLAYKLITYRSIVR